MKTLLLETNSSLVDNSSMDQEKLLLDRLVQEIIDAGIPLQPTTIVNLYVSLKSKPLAILVGPQNSGKDTFIKTFSRFLIRDNNLLRYQFMIGHPWWANQSKNITSLGHLHAQFNAEKLWQLFEDAWRQENEKNLYITGLCKISPAEVVGFFSELSRQLQRGKIIDLPEIYALVPFYYPHNLLTLGSLDATVFDWYDENLLPHTSIIHWPQISEHSTALPNLTQDENGLSLGDEFLYSRIRNEGAAHLKIQNIFGDQSLALMPLLEVESILMKHGVDFSTRQVTVEAVIYLSNAWSNQDNGLFHPSLSRNLLIALDFVISQIILPRAWDSIKWSSKLFASLKAFLGNQFPLSTAFLDHRQLAI
jgi:hypothetical protein